MHRKIKFIRQIILSTKEEPSSEHPSLTPNCEGWVGLDWVGYALSQRRKLWPCCERDPGPALFAHLGG